MSAQIRIDTPVRPPLDGKTASDVAKATQGYSSLSIHQSFSSFVLNYSGKQNFPLIIIRRHLHIPCLFRFMRNNNSSKGFPACKCTTYIRRTSWIRLGVFKQGGSKILVSLMDTLHGHNTVPPTPFVPSGGERQRESE